MRITKEKLCELYSYFYNDDSPEVLTTGQKNISCKQSKHCILFLDELNRAPVDVRQSALQLVLERKIHEHELPVVNGTRTLVVSAINPADDYQVDELDPALLDRFLHISVQVDAGTWLSWAKKNNINDIVRNFIAEHPDRLSWKSPEGHSATPRSWAKLAAYISNKDKIPEEILFQIIRGKVGVEIGSQFYTYLTNYKNLISAEDVITLISEKSKEVQDMKELGDIIAEKTSKLEAVQKVEIAESIDGKDDTFSLLAFLYSLEIELCVSFLKRLRAFDTVKYRELADLDSKLNDKMLFRSIISKAGVQ